MSSWRKCQWRPNALLKWCLGEIITFDNICMKDWRWIVPQSFIVTVVVIWSPNVLNNSQVLLMMHQHLVRAMVWTGLFFGWCKYVKAYYTCKHFTYGRVLTHKRNFFSVFSQILWAGQYLSHLFAILRSQIEAHLGFSSTPRAHMILI